MEDNMKCIKRHWKAFRERQELKKCTECGKKFNKLEWGGRLHTTSKGTSYVHPVDYIMTLNDKTFDDKRKSIDKLEKVDRLIRETKIKNGEKFCGSHYKGCPK